MISLVRPARMSDVVLAETEKRTDDDTDIHFIKQQVRTSLLGPSHIQYSLRHFTAIPGAYTALDQNRHTSTAARQLDLLPADYYFRSAVRGTMDWLTGVTTGRKSSPPPPVPPPPPPAPSQKRRVRVVIDEDEDAPPSTSKPSFSSPFPFTTPHLPQGRPALPRRPFVNLGPSPARPPPREQSTGRDGPVSLPYYEMGVPDYGIYTVATPSVFGGLHYDSYGTEAALVSQYNLSSFWRRRELGGVEGRIRPLLGVRMDSGALIHPPGWPSYCAYSLPLEDDREQRDRRGRNLIAASKRREGEKTVEIWTVNERSRRKKLERLSAKVKKDGGLRRVKMVDELDMRGVVIELRRVEWSEGAVWVRRIGGALSIVSGGEEGEGLTEMEMERGDVRDWSESLWMNGEMAILMDDSTLKHGTLDRMMPVQTGNLPIETVTHTDHPRVVVVGGGQLCSLLDLREKMRKRLSPHFTVPPLTSGDHYLYPRFDDRAMPTVRHLQTMRDTPRNTVVVTDVGLYVVDERCSERPLLSTSHAMYGGGDGVWYEGRKREDGGKTHTLTMVDHRREQWMEWQVHEGEGGGLSSVGPWKRIKEMEGRKTRAVCYVETREGRTARVRQVDDGSIHYEVIGEEGWKEEEGQDEEMEGGRWEDDVREEWKGGRREGRIVDARVREQVDEKAMKMRLRQLREWMEKEEEEGEEEGEGREDVDELVEEWKEDLSEKWMIGRGLKKVYEYHMEEKERGVEGEEEADEYVEWSIPADERLEEELERRRRRKEEILFMREGEKMRKRREKELAEEQEMNEDTVARDEDVIPPLDPPLDEAVDNLSLEKEKEKDTDPLQDEITAGAAEDACGFRGSFTTAIDPKGTVGGGKVHDAGNLAQTYSALISLAILGDDMSKVKRSAILNTVKKAQTELGCFNSQGVDSECDMRYVYCAVSIAYMLGDDSCIDWKRLGEFIQKCVCYDGGIGQMPGDESHGGSTYCAIAALSLANRLWDESVLTKKQLQRLIKWAVYKQERGFHGRANKQDDSCYAFWIGATLEILNSFTLVGQEELRSFLYSVQFPPLGGFCKLQEQGGHPDLLHTYFSLAALSILQEPGFQSMHTPLNVTRRVHEAVARRRIQFAHLPSV